MLDGKPAGRKSQDNSSPDSWYTLLSYDDLMHWQQDNHYIRTGYRKASYSYKRSIQSILHWHNESINIWTHLIPGLLSLPMALMFYKNTITRYAQASTTDVIVMSCFFVGAGCGMLLSGLFHTLSDHSPMVARLWNQLDYAGIALMIWGSFVPSVYYGLWCESSALWAYWTMITVVGVACIAVTLTPSFRSPAWRAYRTAVFISMGLCATFPVIHGLRLYGLSQMKEQIGLFWLVLQGLLYIIGALIYALRWPERTDPGRFDTLGASHQIFHVFVVLAAAAHFRGLLIAFDNRHSKVGLVC